MKSGASDARFARLLPDGAEARFVDEWLSGPGDLRVNTATRHTFVGDRLVDLTRTPFDLLVTLLRDRGRVIPTADLIREVWGFEATDDIHFARTAIYRLRKQLRDAGAPHVIEAIRGVGFRIPGETDLAVEDPVVIGNVVAAGATTAIPVVTPDRRVKMGEPRGRRADRLFHGRAARAVLHG